MKSILPTACILFGLLCSVTLFGCGSNEGFAPTHTVSIHITPDNLIIPKGITTSLKVINLDTLSGEVEVTDQSSCTSDNAVLAINSAGRVTNSYAGTSIVRLTITCRYEGETSRIPVTIVPAVLESLLLTKNNLTMSPGQSQSIQVYGNFKDSLNWIFALDMTNYATWSSTNTAVSLPAEGRVPAFSAGAATITASFGGLNVSTPVTISNGATLAFDPKGVGLLGTYYDFGKADPSAVPWTSVIGDPFEVLFGSRIDSQVYFDWSTGINNLGQPYYFGIRWTGKIYIPASGSYTFYSQTDDGIRLWLNGQLVIDNWTLHATTENTTTPLALTAGQMVDVRMEYFENAGYSVAQLKWSGPSIPKQLIPQINLFPQ